MEMMTNLDQGCVIAQAASRQLLTVVAGISDGQRGTGAGFLRVLRFPLPSIQPTASKIGHSVASLIADSILLHPKYKKTLIKCTFLTII
jgi:hypothetical protein